MKPTVVLERVTTAFGEMILLQHDRDYAIRVAGIELMGSRDHRSEDELGRIGCAGLGKHRAPRMMIGGLGLGFTLRTALDGLPPTAHVDVVEIVPEVVRWNRTIYGALAGHPLDDPRVAVIEDDVQHVIANPPARYDAIVLDVDNGPDAISRINTTLYKHVGLVQAHAALAPGGLYAVWSAFPSPTFTTWLTGAGFTSVEMRNVKARRGMHYVWLARRS